MKSISKRSYNESHQSKDTEFTIRSFNIIFIGFEADITKTNDIITTIEKNLRTCQGLKQNLSKDIKLDPSEVASILDRRKSQKQLLEGAKLYGPPVLLY